MTGTELQTAERRSGRRAERLIGCLGFFFLLPTLRTDSFLTKRFSDDSFKDVLVVGFLLTVMCSAAAAAAVVVGVAVKL